MDKKRLELATELRHELHRHPELSMQEVGTKKMLMDFLRKHTKLELFDKGRWFYALYKASADAPVIGFRADFDAVPVLETCEVPWKSQNPGVAHKCGHDGHSASLAGFALEVDAIRPDVSIVFLFQHAEETGEGAMECQQVIDEQNVSEFFGYHNMTGLPAHTVGLRNGPLNCASCGMSIFFTGKPSHASEPELGINPAQAMSRLVQAVPDIISPDKWKEMVLATVVHMQVGEAAFGVSPGEGVVRLTCRAVLENEMEALMKQVEAESKRLADEYGLSVRFEQQDRFPETANHKSSADKVRKAAAELGYPLEDMEKPMRGSEDFGYYTKRVPGAMFWIGNPESTPLHSHEYDFPDSHIEQVVEIYKKLMSYPIG